MHVLIAGGTGTIGQRLVRLLLAHNYQVSVLSRRSLRPPALPREIGFLQWDGKTAAGWASQLEQIDAVVNLTGANLADERWTDERKKELFNSRIDPGHALVEAMAAVSNKPQVFIQSSAVGYYGPQDDTPITEEHEPGQDFAAKLCIEWEASTKAVEAMGIRRVVTRSGVMLDPDAGALPRMTLPFKLFVGGPVGSGRQWFSWIHYADEVAAIKFLIETEAATGPFNLAAPEPVRNQAYAKAVGRVLKRPALTPVPAFMLKLMFGEMASVLLEGQRVVPARLEALGFRFTFPAIEPALADLLGD